MKLYKYCILVLGFLFVFMVSCKTPYIRSAKIYLFDVRPPDYENAIAQLNKELQVNPTNAEANFLLGYIYSSKGDYEKMTENFRLASEHNLDPSLTKDMKEIEEKAWVDVFSKGTGLASQDSLEQALKWFELSMLIDPQRYEGYLNYCVTAAKMDNYDKALPYCEKAYQLVPDDGNVQNTYAIVLVKSGKYDEVLEIYDKILKRDPSNINALTNLAMIYGQKGDDQNAMGIYDKILQLEPEHKDAYFNRGLLFMKQAQGYYDKLKEANDYLAADPKNKQLEVNVKQLLVEQKETYSKAESDFGKVVELDPNDTEAIVYFGGSLFHQEKWDEALPVFEKMVSIDPNSKQSWSYLAVVYTKKGMKDKAVDAARKAGISE